MIFLCFLQGNLQTLELFSQLFVCVCSQSYIIFLFQIFFEYSVILATFNSVFFLYLL